MKVICAGLPKTGTKSVASALRMLGYNVHDIEQHWRHYLDEYVDAFEGKGIPKFATMYANVDAITDIPACLFWKELFAAFSDAKVILMVRDSEEIWEESLRKTNSVIMSLRSSLWMRLAHFCTPTGRKWARHAVGIRKALVGDDMYTKHNARVKSSIPRDQLLVYNVKQGWKPLCEFLGVKVPDVPFPRLNVNSQYIHAMHYDSYLYKRMSKELIIILAFVVLICAVLIYQSF